MEYGDVRALRQLDADRIVLTFLLVVVPQTTAEVSSIGANDVVLSWIKGPVPLEDSYADLILRDTNHSLVKSALGNIKKK